MKFVVLLIALCLMVSACATSPRGPASEGVDPQTYRVQKGDSVSKIAMKTGTTVSLLVRWNQLTPPYTIYPGQTLYLGDPSGLPKINSKGPKSVTIERVRSQSQTIPPPPLVKRSEKFSWPLKGPLLSSFGQKDGGQQNDGINIAAKRGTKIRAADGGRVVYVGNEVKGFGNLVLIRHDAQWVTAYAHADQILVEKGDAVTSGEAIATVGQTGSVTRPQLHFEIRYKGRPVEPLGQLMP